MAIDLRATVKCVKKCRPLVLPRKCNSCDKKFLLQIMYRRHARILWFFGLGIKQYAYFCQECHDEQARIYDEALQEAIERRDLHKERAAKT